jgi:hypothetical protein
VNKTIPYHFEFGGLGLISGNQLLLLGEGFFFLSYDIFMSILTVNNMSIKVTNYSGMIFITMFFSGLFYVNSL